MRLVSLAYGAEISKRKVPNVEWDTITDMDEEKKDQVLFAMFAAESKGLEGFQKVKHIVEKMKTLYGGRWVVMYCPAGHGESYFTYKTGFLASFKYEGNHWEVVKISNE